MRVIILGTGVAASDLLERLSRFSALDLVASSGEENEFGAVLRDHAPELVFDCTNAVAHAAVVERLLEAAAVVVDLTPAGCGALVVPAVEATIAGVVGTRHVSLATPQAQMAVPLVAALAQVTPVVYAEIVSTTATAAVGVEARCEIDDTIETTVAALRTLGGARVAKAIALVGPGDPPQAMRASLQCLVPAATDRSAAEEAAAAGAAAAACLSPGYRLSVPPAFEPEEHGLLRVSMVAEVVASPPLRNELGGIELLTSAAAALAERFVSTEVTS